MSNCLVQGCFVAQVMCGMEKEKKTIKKQSAPKAIKKVAVKKIKKIKSAEISEETIPVSETAPLAISVKQPAVESSEDTETLKQLESGMAMEGKSERYWEAVGRRKKATARVRLFTRGDKTIVVNDKPYGEYFNTKEQQKVTEESLQKMKSANRFRVSAHVSGGGLNAQAEAIRHGIARALVEFNPDFRKRLRRSGFLTRDPRMKERKKFGLKAARKRPQWAKR